MTATAQSASTNAFLASIGVSTHVDATDTEYGNVAAVMRDLAYTGIGLIRDHAYDTSLPALGTLAAAGVQLDLITDVNPAEEVAQFTPLAPHIRYFEGANEVNAWVPEVPGLTGAEATLFLQRQLYEAVKSTPSLATVSVINESLSGLDPAEYATYRATLAYADYANVHIYSNNGDAPGAFIADLTTGVDPVPTLPTLLTETGYYTLPQSTVWGGVSEDAQAKYTLDTLFDQFALGSPATFLYELLDENPDPAGTNLENHLGLFRADGTAKRAADALHNLTTVLAAPAHATAAVSLSGLTVSGLPETGQFLTLAKSAGTSDVVLWAEPPIWDEQTQRDVAVAPTPVTVDFGQSVASISVYDPLLGTGALAIFHNVQSIVVGVSDHPLIIEVSGAPAPTDFVFANTSAGTSGGGAGTSYSGPVSYLQQQYLWDSADSVSLAANIPNVFLHGGTGNDALAVSSGSNVLDGGAGSNFLVGAVGGDGGTDTFFLDGRGDAVTWSTVVNFHHGDSLTLFGFTPNVSTLTWTTSEGATGYQGLTLHSELAGAGHGVNASMTLAGLGLADLASKLTLTTSTVGGTPYLSVVYTG